MVQITQFLRRAVQTRPRGIASVCDGRARTWEEFEARISSLAAGMIDLGCRPGDRVGILALNSDRYLEYFFAMAWGGLIFVPLNTRLAAPEIAYALADSGCRALFVDDAFLDVLTALSQHTPDLKHLVHLGNGQAPDGLIAYEALVAKGLTIDRSESRGDDLAGLFYTGGTTGRSKAVMLSHRNIVSNAMLCSQEFKFSPDTVLLHAGPMFHLADGSATFLATGVGGKHVFIPRFDAGLFLEAIAKHRVTETVCVPTMLNMVVNHPQAAAADISSLRSIIYGASPMPEAVIRRALEVMPQIGFVQCYGQTEASPVIAMMSRDYHVLDGPRSGRLKTAGIVGYNCEIGIHDDEDREVQRGSLGEIVVRGDNVMLGYWQQPELTAHTLRNGWLHTGDVGRIDEDGFIHVIDRAKDMIISGGENVYCLEVEQALYQHSDVAECAVIGVPDAKWGERVHAVVRLKAGREQASEDLVAHCKALIAAYKCPRTIDFVETPLPLSGAGKVLKTELRKPYWEGMDRAVN